MTRHADIPATWHGGLADAPTLTTIDLDELVGTADLAARFDAKYLVPEDELVELMSRLEGFGRLRVLDVRGRQTHDYVTHYFDTPDLALYRAHVQGRRRRYKLRTRHHSDDAPVLELKLKDGRGRTMKLRSAHTGDPKRLSDEAIVGVRRWLTEHPGYDSVDDLGFQVTTSYQRSTFLLEQPGAHRSPTRITVDRGLRAESDGRARRLSGRSDDPQALVEIKSTSVRADATAALRSLGHRPERLSKYCLAQAALRPHDVRTNPWRWALRRLAENEHAVA